MRFEELQHLVPHGFDQRAREIFDAAMLRSGISPDDLKQFRKRNVSHHDVMKRVFPDRGAAKDAVQAVDRPARKLMVHALKLRKEGIEVTGKTLATSLKIAMSTLYRPPYSAKDIRRTCKLGRECGPEHIETPGQRGGKVNTVRLDEKFAEQLTDCRRW
jgi:hypothetical protein